MHRYPSTSTVNENAKQDDNEVPLEFVAGNYDSVSVVPLMFWKARGAQLVVLLILFLSEACRGVLVPTQADYISEVRRKSQK